MKPSSLLAPGLMAVEGGVLGSAVECGLLKGWKHGSRNRVFFPLRGIKRLANLAQ